MATKQEKIENMLANGNYFNMMKKATLRISEDETIEINSPYIDYEVFRNTTHYVKRTYIYDSNLAVADMLIDTNLEDD